MKILAAIFIKKHSYLFNTPQTINFGGKYIYSFHERDNGAVSYDKNENPHYIENFFNTTNSRSVITNISAIVGQNGAGKTSILDIVRSIFSGNENAFPYCEFYYILEDGDDACLQYQSRNAKSMQIQSIYYSPHFDYRYNHSFDSDITDNHDISFDKILESDLSELSKKDTNENGWSYTPTQELLFKNSIRQMEFLASDIVKEQKIFNEIFELPDYSGLTLIIRGYKLDNEEWNTPYQFRSMLMKIKNKIEEEINAWHKILKRENDKVLNQLEINQYIVKRNILIAALSILRKQMEKNNSYLDNGIFPHSEIEQSDELAAYDLLKFFVNKATVYDRPIFQLSEDSTSLMKLVDKLYEIINMIDNEEDISKSSIRISKEYAVEILKQQRRVISELNEYYPRIASISERQKEENYEYKTIPESERIDGFINFRPFDKRLSSGEHALLNLFSRLYNFLNSNFITNKFRELKNHYIILIDEGDLGFHPCWKKRYIKSLLNTLPYFFEKLENKPSFEILFTTHDPLTLSDIPNNNVVYIKREDYSSFSEILDSGSNERPSKTFGANITDLLADSFFTEKSLIGDFAFDSIKKCIEWLNHKDDFENKENYRKIIHLIDEPIVQRKLAEMYDDKMKEYFSNEIIDKQIERLRRLKK